jgi:pteridine reductase
MEVLLMQSALVTGCAHRIGAAIARELASRGFNLHLHAHTSAEDLERLADDLRHEYRHIAVVTHIADFADFDSVRSFMSELTRQGSALSLVVNNASIFEEDYDLSAVWDIELVARTLMINTAVPLVLAGLVANAEDGHVVNITDGHVNLTCSSHLPYDVSKAALEDSTRRLAVLLAPNVRVNAIAPGLVLPPAGRDHEYLRQMALRAPLGKPSRVEDTIAALRFLCDTKSITGASIKVDSGEHLVWDSESSGRPGGN